MCMYSTPVNTEIRIMGKDPSWFLTVESRLGTIVNCNRINIYYIKCTVSYLIVNAIPHDINIYGST